MQINFSIGDKVYEKDLSKEAFLECQLHMSKACISNHWCLESGNDENGYFIIINRAPKSRSDSLVFEQVKKKDELKELWQTVQEQPIEYNGSYYDCDSVSVLQMRCILDAVESGELGLDYWTDTYNVDVINFTAEDLRNVLSKYSQRCVKLHSVYKELKARVMNCKTFDELEEIDGSEFYFD